MGHDCCFLLSPEVDLANSVYFFFFILWKLGIWGWYSWRASSYGETCLLTKIIIIEALSCGHHNIRVLLVWINWIAGGHLLFRAREKEREFQFSWAIIRENQNSIESTICFKRTEVSIFRKGGGLSRIEKLGWWWPLLAKVLDSISKEMNGIFPLCVLKSVVYFWEFYLFLDHPWTPSRETGVPEAEMCHSVMLWICVLLF